MQPSLARLFDAEGNKRVRAETHHLGDRWGMICSDPLPEYRSADKNRILSVSVCLLSRWREGPLPWRCYHDGSRDEGVGLPQLLAPGSGEKQS